MAETINENFAVIVEHMQVLGFWILGIIIALTIVAAFGLITSIKFYKRLKAVEKKLEV